VEGDDSEDEGGNEVEFKFDNDNRDNDNDDNYAEKKTKKFKKHGTATRRGQRKGRQMVGLLPLLVPLHTCVLI
jgi:hypothetical protein